MVRSVVLDAGSGGVVGALRTFRGSAGQNHFHDNAKTHVTHAQCSLCTNAAKTMVGKCRCLSRNPGRHCALQASIARYAVRQENYYFYCISALITF